MVETRLTLEQAVEKTGMLEEDILVLKYDSSVYNADDEGDTGYDKRELFMHQATKIDDYVHNISVVMPWLFKELEWAKLEGVFRHLVDHGYLAEVEGYWAGHIGSLWLLLDDAMKHRNVVNYDLDWVTMMGDAGQFEQALELLERLELPERYSSETIERFIEEDPIGAFWYLGEHEFRECVDMPRKSLHVRLRDHHDYEGAHETLLQMYQRKPGLFVEILEHIDITELEYLPHILELARNRKDCEVLYHYARKVYNTFWSDDYEAWGELVMLASEADDGGKLSEIEDATTDPYAAECESAADLVGELRELVCSHFKVALPEKVTFSPKRGNYASISYVPRDTEENYNGTGTETGAKTRTAS